MLTRTNRSVTLLAAAAPAAPAAPAAAPAAPAADVADRANEEIRAFMRARLGRSLWPEEARQYAVLLERWQSAARNLSLVG